MRFLLLVATLSLVFAEEAQTNKEPEAAESAHEYSYKDGLELMHDRDRQLHSQRHRIHYGSEYDHEYNQHDHRHGHHDHRHGQYGHTNDYHHSNYDFRYHNDHHNNQHNHYYKGPVILRYPAPLAHDGHIDIKSQNRVIEDVYSPDYAQPIWVLDYRYLKSGGRDYVRGLGGRVLILPHGVRSKEKKQFNNYDALIEHLRLSRIAEEQHQYRLEHRNDRYGYQGHSYDHGSGHGHGHDQNPYGHH